MTGPAGQLSVLVSALRQPPLKGENSSYSQVKKWKIKEYWGRGRPFLSLFIFSASPPQSSVNSVIALRENYLHMYSSCSERSNCILFEMLC